MTVKFKLLVDTVGNTNYRLVRNHKFSFQTDILHSTFSVLTVDRVRRLYPVRSDFSSTLPGISDKQS